MHLPLALQNDHPSLHFQSTLAHHPLNRTEQAVIGFGIDARQEKKREKRAVVGSLGQQSFSGNCSGKKSSRAKNTVASHKASGRPLPLLHRIFPPSSSSVWEFSVCCNKSGGRKFPHFLLPTCEQQGFPLCSGSKRQLRRRRRK